jgi:hypothetical protein
MPQHDKTIAASFQTAIVHARTLAHNGDQFAAAGSAWIDLIRICAQHKVDRLRAEIERIKNPRGIPPARTPPPE